MSMNPKIPIRVGQIRKVNSGFYYLVLSKVDSSAFAAWNIVCFFGHGVKKHLNITYQWAEDTLLEDELISGSR